jgi:hypothetical protein
MEVGGSDNKQASFLRGIINYRDGSHIFNRRSVANVLKLFFIGNDVWTK